MNLNDKVVRTEQMIRFVEFHDDAPVAEVRSSLREIARLAKAAEKRLLQRRNGGFMERILGRRA